LRFDSLHIALLLGIVFSVLAGCNRHAAPNSALEDYTLVFETVNGNIPVRISLSDSLVQFRNAEEVIDIAVPTNTKDTIRFSLPNYDSEMALVRVRDSLRGYWVNHHKTDYRIEFRGFRSANEKRNPIKQEPTKYRIAFGGVDSSAVGIFLFNGETVTGTFLTETGDYRYLEGKREGDRFYLSCFDGAHLFYFSATISEDGSLRDGVFLSGKHYRETWTGVPDRDIELRDPDHITAWTHPEELLSFSAKNIDGLPIDINQSAFEGMVTAVSLVGSWCPNCTDLEKYLIPKQTNSRFRFIPVCFETATDSLRLRKQLERHFSDLGHEGIILLGGRASKSEAASLFPYLTSVSAFPTTMLVDEQGRVRHIHTGFYGPGTAEYHQLYVQRLDEVIDQLLSELSFPD
jgi:hypothetical protein